MHGTVAVDFLVIPTIRFRILFVFVVLSHNQRRVVHSNVTSNPTAQQIVEAFSWDTAPRYLLGIEAEFLVSNFNVVLALWVLKKYK